MHTVGAWFEKYGHMITVAICVFTAAAIVKAPVPEWFRDGILAAAPYIIGKLSKQPGIVAVAADGTKED